MAKEALTHSDRYVRKTNRIILIVGIITLCLFVFGLLLLGAEEPEEEQKYEVESTIDAETDLGIANETSNEAEIEFGEAETEEKPITLTPNPINMGQVVIGNEASNVLTIGTNGKFAIRIVSVELEDAPFEGFSFKTDCGGRELRGKITCSVLMNWLPTIAANVQNNFKIIWHETRLSERDAKHDEVSVFGSAVTKEDCNFCDNGNAIGSNAESKFTTSPNQRYAIGPDGKVIGIIDENGEVRDFNGNVIGKVTADGLIVDRDGNVIGVAGTGKMILDENGNVIGYVDENGVAYDMDGNVIGNMMADGTVVDANGRAIGKAIDYGYVYDENGNIIGRVLPDGSVVDLDGNVIGKVDENGNVVDFNGNVIGRVAKSGEVMFDENGNPIGIVMPNGTIVNENGDVVGRLDKNGNAVAMQKIGKRGPNRQLAVDENGNVIGYIDENGVVRDFNGNVIGKVDENGNIVDENGKIIGKASDQWGDLALDENGNVIGYIDKDGLVHDNSGEIVGYVNDKGEIIGNAVKEQIIGKVGAQKQLAYDANGNVIGYVDENGNVRDANGNVIGKVDADGNVIDKNGNIIGKVADGKRRLAYDANGNVIGYVDENGNVRDFSGNVIGKVDADGNVIDKNGNIIGKVAPDSSRNIAYDANGNVIGYVDENGNVRDFNGNIIGYVDENGNVVSKSAEAGGIIGSKGEQVTLAYDADGNVIGYIDENGNVVDANGNIIGHVDENGNIVDENGNIIGRRGNTVNWALDENGNVIGYIDENGVVRNFNGDIIGVSDKNGVIKAIGTTVIGRAVNKNLLPITPEGKVLGTINNRGEVVSQQQIVGKMQPNGLVTDMAGNKILAQGVNPGIIVNWGCDYSARLDKDGIVRKDGVDINARVYADGTVWSQEGKFIGMTMRTGSVYNNECQYVGEATADGYVRDINGREIGCLNPDGTVLDLETPNIKGHLVEARIVYSGDWNEIGILGENGTLSNEKGDIIGCMNHNGEVMDKYMAYIGTTADVKYAFDFNGKFLGQFTTDGKIKIAGIDGANVILNKYVADKNKEIIGIALPAVNILYDAKGQRLGHLFPNGNVYDEFGAVVGKINGGENGIYNDKAAKFFYPQTVVGMDGRLLGMVNYDLSVVDFKGALVGKINTKGQMFDDLGQQIGGVVKQGGVRAYNGVYLGYVLKNGSVVELENIEDENNKYARGDITGQVVPDGHVIKDGKIIGEVLPLNLMSDVLGNYVGYANDHGVVISQNGSYLAALLPGGNTTSNLGVLPQGFVVNFAGQIIGIALPTGQFSDTRGIISGRVLADGKVINSDGKFLGEVVSGDIVIGNDDNLKGLVGFDGQVYHMGNVVGHIVTDSLAVDLQNNVLGHVHSIGHTVLSNNGEFVGRVNARGKVIENVNREVGYIKSNGSFVDVDKNVSGYSLPEAARNRRN